MAAHISSPRLTMPGILGALLLVLGFLVTAGSVAVLRSIEADETARRERRETAAVMEGATALLADLALTESAQRGFLLTGDRRHLDAYAESLLGVQADLARLETMPGAPGEPVAGLRAQVRAKLSEMARTVELAEQARGEEAVALVRDGRGRRLMDDIRQRLATMSESERKDLEQSYAEVDRTQERFRWQLILLAMAALGALILAALAMRRAAHSAAEARYLHEVRAQRDRADLVRRELSHRVKNLFAVIMSIISTTGRTETDPREAARKTRERVQALARAHALSSGESELRTARLRDLVEAVAGPYVPPGQFLEIEGPDVVLPAQIVTPLGLILNELATNAVKYGGWAQSAGTVAVRWQFTVPNELNLRWKETGLPPGDRTSPYKGFGTTMIDLSAEQAGATLGRNWSAEEFELQMKLTLSSGMGSAM